MKTKKSLFKNSFNPKTTLPEDSFIINVFILKYLSINLFANYEPFKIFFLYFLLFRFLNNPRKDGLMYLNHIL